MGKNKSNKQDKMVRAAISKYVKKNPPTKVVIEKKAVVKKKKNKKKNNGSKQTGKSSFVAALGKTLGGALVPWARPIVEKGIDFISTLTTGGSNNSFGTFGATGDVLTTVTIAPRALTSTRLAKMSELYQRFIFTKVVVHYTPSVNVTQSGQMIGYFDTDPADTPPSGIEGINYANSHGGVLFQISDRASFTMPIIKDRTYYTSYNDVTEDERFKVQAVFRVLQVTGLPASTALGSFSVDYVCNMDLPQMTEAIEVVSSGYRSFSMDPHYNVSGNYTSRLFSELVTNNYPLGPLPPWSDYYNDGAYYKQIGGSYGIVFDNEGKSWPPGLYFLQLRIRSEDMEECQFNMSSISDLGHVLPGTTIIGGFSIFQENARNSLVTAQFTIDGGSDFSLDPLVDVTAGTIDYIQGFVIRANFDGKEKRQSNPRNIVDALKKEVDSLRHLVLEDKKKGNIVTYTPSNTTTTTEEYEQVEEEKSVPWNRHLLTPKQIISGPPVKIPKESSNRSLGKT